METVESAEVQDKTAGNGWALETLRSIAPWTYITLT